MNRCLRSVLLCCLIMAIVLPGAAWAKKVLVDKMVAVIGITTLSAGDIQLEKKIQTYAHDSFMYPEQEQELTDAQVFIECIVRELLYQQAVKLGFDKVKEEQTDEKMMEFSKAFGSQNHYFQFLLSMELSDPRFDKQMEGNVEWQNFKSLTQRFRTVLIARQFVEKRIGLQVKLKLESAFKEQRTALSTQFPNADDKELMGILEQHMLHDALKKWVTDVASRTSIKIYVKDYAKIWKESVHLEE